MIDFLTGAPITISNDLVNLESDPFAETVVEVGEVKLKFNPFAETVVEADEVKLKASPTEGFALDVPGATVEFSEEVSLGIADIVKVEADPIGLPDVEIFGLGLSELADPSTIPTLALLAVLSDLA